jgi:Spy/CpxP family protein refolding chaperone
MRSRLLASLLLFAGAAPAQFFPQKIGGHWWKQPTTIQLLNLTPEQQKRLDDAFQQYRVRLIDHTAALEREEVILEQLMAADPLDPNKVRPEIDKVAEARAQLEKTNASMLLDMRMVLTKDQWEALKTRNGSGGPIPKKPAK